VSNIYPHKFLRGEYLALHFQVPLNHADSSAGNATIALIRVPASVKPDSTSYRGPILFNPGGPGGSGVGMIAGPDGDSYSTILGPEFDIVGFDPRGTQCTHEQRMC